MCGILGSVNKPFSDAELNTIRHRGPDDGGIESLEIAGQLLCFGHRRLSIQDLSPAGHQPMWSACGKFLLVFNGEIYNHYDLRAKLKDINFRGHSDTETIVNYIACYGIESSQDFNGIFSFAILDIQKNLLYLARDRFGVKPLYYSFNEEQLIFSSEIRPIQLLSPSNICKDNLATLLKLRYNPSPSTLYESIQKLRPGHLLKYNLTTMTARTCSFVKSVRSTTQMSFDEAVVEYGRLFEQAIARQMLADVEVGVLLSGGIDSALVAYYAQMHSKTPVKTFTIGFEENDESDETLDARETAQILGTDHYEIKISEKQFEEAFQKCIGIVEEPLGTTSIIPMYFLNELVARHVKVVLTGQGADEPLGGYTRYKGEMLYGKIPSILFRLLKPFSRGIKNESAYRAINSLGETNVIKRFEMIYALFNDSKIKDMIGRTSTKSLEFIDYFYTLLDGKKKESVNAMMSNDLRMNLSDDLLLYTDKISMNFSIEARVPILDNDLVAFVESLPVGYKIHGKEGKYIHKKFAETVLPSQIIYREKKGFKSPTEKWFKGEKGRFYKRLLTQENSRFSEFFNVGKVGEIFDMHSKGKRNMEKQLFTLISIYYWMDANCLQNMGPHFE